MVNVGDALITLIARFTDGEKENKVFASVESSPQSEFYSAAQTGYKAAYKVTLWQCDYNDQPLVKLCGSETRYTVGRRYFRHDGKVELFLVEKAGTR